MSHIRVRGDVAHADRPGPPVEDCSDADSPLRNAWRLVDNRRPGYEDPSELESMSKLGHSCHSRGRVPRNFLGDPADWPITLRRKRMLP